MKKSLYAILLSLMILSSCGIPKTNLVKPDTPAVIIKGFTNPSKVMTLNNDLYILDENEGLIQIQNASIPTSGEASVSFKYLKPFDPTNTYYDKSRTTGNPVAINPESSSFNFYYVDFDIAGNSLYGIMKANFDPDGNQETFTSTDWFYVFRADMTTPASPVYETIKLSSLPNASNDNTHDKVSYKANFISATQNALYLSVGGGTRVSFPNTGDYTSIRYIILQGGGFDARYTGADLTHDFAKDNGNFINSPQRLMVSSKTGTDIKVFVSSVEYSQKGFFVYQDTNTNENLAEKDPTLLTQKKFIGKINDDPATTNIDEGSYPYAFDINGTDLYIALDPYPELLNDPTKYNSKPKKPGFFKIDTSGTAYTPVPLLDGGFNNVYIYNNRAYLSTFKPEAITDSPRTTAGVTEITVYDLTAKKVVKTITVEGFTRSFTVCTINSSDYLVSANPSLGALVLNKL